MISRGQPLRMSKSAKIANERPANANLEPLGLLLHKLVLRMHAKCKRKRTLHMHFCIRANLPASPCRVFNRGSGPSRTEDLLHIRNLRQGAAVPAKDACKIERARVLQGLHKVFRPSAVACTCLAGAKPLRAELGAHS